MAQTLKRKKSTKKTASKLRKNPKKSWWHKIPGFRRVFSGVDIGQSQIPVEGGTLIIESENAPAVGKIHQRLSEILGDKKVKISFAPHKGRQISLSIILPKDEDEDGDEMRRMQLAQMGIYG